MYNDIKIIHRFSIIHELKILMTEVTEHQVQGKKTPNYINTVLGNC